MRAVCPEQNPVAATVEQKFQHQPLMKLGEVGWCGALMGTRAHEISLAALA